VSWRGGQRSAAAGTGASDQEAERQRWRELVAGLVVPRVEAALGNPGHKSTRIRPAKLTVSGSWSAVYIRGAIRNGDGWVVPTLEGMRDSDHAPGYRVRVFGFELSGLPGFERPVHVEQISQWPPSELGLAAGLERYRMQHPNGFFEVRIEM
jgi:hypothetical protein